MKVIDLLVKIANDEELPKKIEYNGTTYELETYDGWQYYIDGVNSMTLLDRINSVVDLNHKIKIIKEDKKIEKLNVDEEENGNNIIWCTEYEQCNTLEKKIIKRQDYIINKINEIIDKVNEVKDE